MSACQWIGGRQVCSERGMGGGWLRSEKGIKCGVPYMGGIKAPSRAYSSRVERSVTTQRIRSSADVSRRCACAASRGSCHEVELPMSDGYPRLERGRLEVWTREASSSRRGGAGPEKGVSQGRKGWR